MEKNDGRNLKNQILNLAGDMFREYGYKGTTFQRIADQLGIAKSTITYYYGNKFMLMEYWIDDYFDMLKKFIDSFHDEYKNKYWRHCVIYSYVYRTMLQNERNQELFYHEKEQSLWQNYEIETVARIYESIEKDFKIPYELDDLRIKAHIDMGARRNLYETYVNSPGSLSINRFVYYHLYLIGILCKLDEKTISENIQSADDFVSKHTPPVHKVFG